MGVFKNGVGRPSNETIKKRNIFKGICVLLVLIIILLVGYILNDKYDFLSDNKNTGRSDKSTTIAPTTTVKQSKIFNKDNIVIKERIDENSNKFYNLYINDKEIATDAISVDYDTLEDIAVFEIGYVNAIDLVIVNNSGETLYEAANFSAGENLCHDLSSECYAYKVENNKIRYYLENMGQEPTTICDDRYDLEVLAEYELTYKDGIVSAPKKLSSLTGKQYIEKHNFNCKTQHSY